MPVSRDEILMDNVKASLDLYQRSLTWSTTASLSALLIAWHLRSGAVGSIAVLSSEVSAGTGMLIAVGLYLLFGAMAFYALERYLIALQALAPSAELLNAILLNPSLATSRHWLRIGSALVPPVVTIITWIIEQPRERQMNADFSWFTYAFILLIFISPYVGIVSAVVRLPRVRQH